MKLKDIEKLCIKEKSQHLTFNGKCYDCTTDVTVKVDVADDGRLTIEGGALCDMGGELNPQDFKVKCDDCYKKNPKFNTKTLVYSRVCGYMMPLDNWNKGKRTEFKTRKVYNMTQALQSERVRDEKS